MEDEVAKERLGNGKSRAHQNTLSIFSRKLTTGKVKGDYEVVGGH